MNSIPMADRNRVLSLEPVTAPVPWHAVLIPCSFSEPSSEYPQVIAFLQAFTSLLVKEANLKQELLLQVWKLGMTEASQIVNDHVREWWPTLGLGIWPDREPPRGWTQEALSDAAAAVFRNDEIPLPSHKLLRLGTEEKARIDAARQLRGFGALIEIFSKDDFKDLEQRSRKAFLPKITEKRFKKARFYLPVLDCHSIAAAKDVEQLDAWLCGTEVYIRESGEDKGILILSRKDPSRFFEIAERKLNENNGFDLSGSK